MGSPNYSTVTLQLGLSYMTCGALGWKYQLEELTASCQTVFSAPGH
jgi:hypothetical protein